MNKLIFGIIILSLSCVVHARHVMHKITPNVPFSAKSFLIADTDGVIIKEHNGNIIRPIASISKLLIGVLSAEQDINELLPVPSNRNVMSSIPRNISFLSRKELLTLALVKSDNLAAQILCNNLPNCVDEMNYRAALIGMTNTHFNEPTGLNPGNVSTAEDLMKLLIVAETNPIITEITKMPHAEIAMGNKIIRINNTNPLTSKLDIVLSKTGFTNPAGGCLAMIINTPVGRRILILLGSKNSKTRIPDMEKLIKEL